MREMQADLMRAAGVQLHVQIRVRAEPFEHAVVCNGGPAILPNSHAQPIVAMTTDGLVHGAATGHDAHANREVFARDRPCQQLPRERGVRLQCARHYQQSAGVFVESMNDPGARQSRQ